MFHSRGRDIEEVFLEKFIVGVFVMNFSFLVWIKLEFMANLINLLVEYLEFPEIITIRDSDYIEVS